MLDLRVVNQFLPKRKFKYEGLNLIPDLCNRGDFLFTFDLKSGYHHVDIHPDCWTYLSFSWSTNGVRKFYKFHVLPFGLSTACYVFTKLLRPLVRHWRSFGYRVILYIDDGIAIASSLTKCVTIRNAILSDLEKAGLVLNIKKSHLVPQRVGAWLGFIIDLEHGMFLVPQEKISKLQNSISSVVLFGRVPVHLLARIVGQIISMSLAIGSIARLNTRYMY